MCGIAGSISLNNPNLLEEVKSMSSIISYRGPDGEGFYKGEMFAFGHRRLAIVDLSELGKQPMEYNGNIITYNGEVYNYIELRSELKSYGFDFRSGTDTEVILAAYDYWGYDCVNKFNGMWSFAIYDSTKNTIFCSRDRFGVKPFYYTEFNDSFYFASEIKQFTVLPEWKSFLNHDRAYDFFAYGIMNHTGETLFNNVFQLKGGQSLIYYLDSNKYEIQDWYTLNNLSSKHSLKEAIGLTKTLFFNSINLRLRSDVKVGSCLSGGIDSSSIVCVVNQILKQSGKDNIQETVSAVYDEKEFSEESFIDKVTSQTSNISHKVNPIFSELFEQLDSIIWHQDEPFLSTSIFAQWSVFNQAAKAEIKVMLDGQGADEYMAGYESFYGVYLCELLCTFRMVKFGNELLALYKNYGIKKVIRSIYWASNNLLYRIPFISESIRMNMKMFFSMSQLNWLKIPQNSIVENIYGTAYKSLKNYSKILLTEITIPTLLHYEDRNSMAFSIESRVPFLDYNLVEFVYSMPNDFKIKNSTTKYIFREAMDGILPNEIKKRKDKVGFATPQSQWIKSNEHFFRTEIERSCDSLNKIVDRKKVMLWFEESFNNDYESLNKFWSIIIFAHWVKIYKVIL